MEPRLADEAQPNGGPTSSDAGGTEDSRSGRAARTGRAFLIYAALGVALDIAYFPGYFNTVTRFDDEGAYVVTLREFLNHGSLYVNTHAPYGPFYYTVFGLIYRLTGQTPTLFNGRLIVFAMTTVSSIFFGATVWRVTRSLIFGALCQVVSYSILVTVTSDQPLHPGQLIVLLLAVMSYILVVYAMTQRAGLLALVGALVGAILMTKANVGFLAAAALVVAFVIGNSQYARWFRGLVVVGAALLPFLLMYSQLWEPTKARFAVIVSFSLLAALATWMVDRISIPPRGLYLAAAGAGTVILVSLLWPLSSGSGPVAIFRGVLLSPRTQTQIHAGELDKVVHIQWVAVILTAAAAYAAVMWRKGGAGFASVGPPWLPDALLVTAGLWVLGQTVTGGLAVWLPAIAVLPALAWISEASPEVRLVLRLLVALAILQALHGYPVAGVQTIWSNAMACAPCVIVVASALSRHSLWRRARPGVRVLTVGALGGVLVMGSGLWPLNLWRNYDRAAAIDLPGARLIRIAPKTAKTLQNITRSLKHNCDTFYSAPGLDSYYVFTGLPTPSGLLPNFPGALEKSEQRKLADQLAKLRVSGKRVCILRDVSRAKGWQLAYGAGPLGQELARYKTPVARFGVYTIAVARADGGQAAEGP